MGEPSNDPGRSEGDWVLISEELLDLGGLDLVGGQGAFRSIFGTIRTMCFMTQVVEESQRTKDWYPPFGKWIGLVLTLGFSALIAIEATHNAWLDVCDSFYEPPTTVLGFTAAALATALPLGFAVWSRSRPVIVIALLAALVEALVWWWLFTPHGTC